MDRGTELILSAKNAAARSAYYDHVAVPDAGDIARHISAASILYKQSNLPNLSMRTLSASLTATGLSTLRANHNVRSLLLRAYMLMPTNAVGGVFGKSLWIFTSVENLLPRSGSLEVPELDQVSDVLEPLDYSNINCLHLRGWISAVASALRRRRPEVEGPSSLHVVNEALIRLRSTDWKCAQEAQTALTTLKTFTQPTWWTTITPTESVDDRRDLHFRALLNERQYRHDMSTMDLKNYTLVVTDVSGLFLGSASHTIDLMRAVRGSVRQVGIATRVLRVLGSGANGPQGLINSIFQERLNAAHELSRTLQTIAECATELDGRTYATHGDGVSILLPQERWQTLLERLTSSSMPLPVALGRAPVQDSPRNAELAAERDLIHAKVSMASAGQWIAAHTDDESPADFGLGLRRLQHLAASDDAVERWIGLKGLRSIATCDSSTGLGTYDI